ncbi:MAG: ParB/RepB/Spo0J family partition protein [Patescibacteria group bacterium]
MNEENKFHNDSIYWVELNKIRPNPYQPRREFNLAKLNDLADSIRQYGVLQPLVVTRKERETEDGGLSADYELIAGERRLRASQIAKLTSVPVIIRTMEDDGRVKLEIAIIENIQREDLNAIDRAYAFSRLVNEFDFKHGEIGQKVGKSREYVSNTIRLLSLPEEVQQALAEGMIAEGHARPVMMLADKPAEQITLFKEIMAKKLTVREAEAISRRVASDRVRKHSRSFDPEMIELENQLTETLGTRVQIEKRQVGGKVTIDFFSADDLRGILDILNKDQKEDGQTRVEKFIENNRVELREQEEAENEVKTIQENGSPEEINVPIDDRSEDEKEIDDEDLYSIKNFSI